MICWICRTLLVIFSPNPLPEGVTTKNISDHSDVRRATCPKCNVTYVLKTIGAKLS